MRKRKTAKMLSGRKPGRFFAVFCYFVAIPILLRILGSGLLAYMGNYYGQPDLLWMAVYLLITVECLAVPFLLAVLIGGVQKYFSGKIRVERFRTGKVRAKVRKYSVKPIPAFRNFCRRNC